MSKRTILFPKTKASPKTIPVGVLSYAVPLGLATSGLWLFEGCDVAKLKETLQQVVDMYPEITGSLCDVTYDLDAPEYYKRKYHQQISWGYDNDLGLALVELDARDLSMEDVRKELKAGVSDPEHVSNGLGPSMMRFLEMRLPANIDPSEPLVTVYLTYLKKDGDIALLFHGTHDLFDASSMSHIMRTWSALYNGTDYPKLIIDPNPVEDKLLYSPEKLDPVADAWAKDFILADDHYPDRWAAPELLPPFVGRFATPDQELIGRFPLGARPTIPPPDFMVGNTVRIFHLSPAAIERIHAKVTEGTTEFLSRMDSLSSYIWVNMVKFREEISDEDTLRRATVVDWRQRLVKNFPELDYTVTSMAEHMAISLKKKDVSYLNVALTNRRKLASVSADPEKYFGYMTHSLAALDSPVRYAHAELTPHNSIFNSWTGKGMSDLHFGTLVHQQPVSPPIDNIFVVMDNPGAKRWYDQGVRIFVGLKLQYMDLLEKALKDDGLLS